MGIITGILSTLVIFILCMKSILAEFLLLFFSYQVFKVSGLAVADANVVHDKQFQLIRFVTNSALSICYLDYMHL